MVGTSEEGTPRGDVSTVEELINGLAVGRRAKAVKKHVPYFTRNRARMQYATFRKKNIPIGSGSVESTVRRVVNMRMKGNGTFWGPDNAEGMLLVRSYLKAGRLDDLSDWSTTRAVSWARSSNHRAAPLGEIAPKTPS